MAGATTPRSRGCEATPASSRLGTSRRPAPTPLQHEIVQIAAVSVAGNFKSLLRPRRGDVTARARELHGLGDEQLRAAPTSPEVVKSSLGFSPRKYASSNPAMTYSSPPK